MAAALDDADERECRVCNRRFSFLRRRRRCCKCGGVFCKEHAMHSKPTTDQQQQYKTKKSDTIICNECWSLFGDEEMKKVEHYNNSTIHKSTSWSVKAKTAVAHMVIASPAGRNFLLRVLGNEADLFVTSMHTSMRRYYSKKIGTRCVKYLMTVAAKLAIVMDDSDSRIHIITNDERDALMKEAETTTGVFANVLSSEPHPSHDAVDQLIQQLHKQRALADSVVQRVLSVQALQHLDFIINHLCQHEYLMELCSNQEYANEKHDMLQAMATFNSDFEQDVSQWIIY